MIRPALTLLLLFTALTGAVYPTVVTGLGQALFPHQANGSLLKASDKVVGSALIGQAFDDPKYFFGRASATTPYPFNGGSSSASNLGPLNPTLKEAVEKRVKALKELDPSNPAPVPIELVTASASGLDPHISPEAAAYQVQRVARVRGLSEDVVRAMVQKHSEGRTFGVLGEPRVNVLELNLDLDRAATEGSGATFRAPQSGAGDGASGTSPPVLERATGADPPVP